MIDKKKIPVALTMSRIFGAPLLLLPFIKDNAFVWSVVTFIFIILSVTDYFDGKLARKYNAVSNFGKYFDPTGDKILVLFALVILMHFKDLNPFFLILLLSRDIIIGSIRSYAASVGLVMDARALGKLKTTLQMISIPILLAPKLIPIPLIGQHNLGIGVMWLACIISVVSLGDYALQLNKKVKQS